MAWEQRERRSPWLPGGVGSSEGLQARSPIPAKWEAGIVGGNLEEPGLRGSLA